MNGHTTIPPECSLVDIYRNCVLSLIAVPLFPEWYGVPLTVQGPGLPSLAETLGKWALWVPVFSCGRPGGVCAMSVHSDYVWEQPMWCPDWRTHPCVCHLGRAPESLHSPNPLFCYFFLFVFSMMVISANSGVTVIFIYVNFIL